MRALQFRAGPQALLKLRRQGGLHPAGVRAVVGASGGPKWLILAGLDRPLFGEWLARSRHPIPLLGSSVGAWRMVLYAQSDPVAALDRFREAYVHEQRYSKKPDPAEVSREVRRLLEVALGEDGTETAVANPYRPLQILTNRMRGNPNPSNAGLYLRIAAAAGSNLVDRRWLGRWVIRSLFESPAAQDHVPAMDALPTERQELSSRNLRAVLAATAAIPGLMEVVREIPEAIPGTYLDGGITDYHPTLAHQTGDGIQLMPHFHGQVIPGWFDKKLRHRHNRSAALDDTLLVAPSPELIASLPYGKIPDRRDFMQLDDDQRIAYWKQVLAASERMGEEFMELVEDGALIDRLQPLDSDEAQR